MSKSNNKINDIVGAYTMIHWVISHRNNIQFMFYQYEFKYLKFTQDIEIKWDKNSKKVIGVCIAGKGLNACRLTVVIED